MTLSERILRVLTKKTLMLMIYGIAAAALFTFGWTFLVKFAGRTDLIVFLDTPLKNTILFGFIVVLFLVSLGEFASNIGKFSLANYAVTTFLAALACYLITPVGEVFNAIDLSDPGHVADALNYSYSVWWIVYLIAFVCALFAGLVINKNKVFASKKLNT